MHLKHHEDHFKFNKTVFKNYFLLSCNNKLGEHVLVRLGPVMMTQTKTTHMGVHIEETSIDSN